MQAANAAAVEALLAHVRDCVRALLHKCRGYECQQTDGEWMLAFASTWDATMFCLRVSPGAVLCWQALDSRCTCFALGAALQLPACSACGMHCAGRHASQELDVVHRAPCCAAQPVQGCSPMLILGGVAAQAQVELLELAYSADELSLPGCGLGLCETGGVIWRGPRVRAAAAACPARLPSGVVV